MGKKGLRISSYTKLCISKQGRYDKTTTIIYDSMQASYSILDQSGYAGHMCVHV